MLRKRLASLLSLALCASVFFSGTAYAAEPEENDQVQNAYELATQALSDFNRAEYLYEDIDLSEYVADPDLLTYLENKADALQVKSIQPTFDKVNFKDGFTLLSHTVSDNLVSMNILSQCSYNYADLLDVDSGSSYGVTITIDTLTNRITKWETNDEYDEEYQSLMNTSTYSAADPSDAQETIYNNYQEYYSSLFNPENAITEEAEILSDPGANTRAVTTLNKSAIVSWANSNHDKKPPRSGDGSTPYYDFSKVPGNYDCTNFVSHALLAGGATKNTSSKDDKGWYYSSMSNRSTSWSGVPNLYNFLTRSSTTKGPKGSSSAYSTFSSSVTSRPYEAGDVIQFRDLYNTMWRHSGIISGYYSPDGTHLAAMVTCRTSELASECNKKAEEMSYGDKRVIRLYANYTS